jgi:hypothetical protein
LVCQIVVPTHFNSVAAAARPFSYDIIDVFSPGSAPVASCCGPAMWPMALWPFDQVINDQPEAEKIVDGD